jgi:anti-sigma-K factor RskA
VGVAAVAVAAVFVGAIAGSAIAPRTEDALSAFLDRSDVRVVALEPTGDAGGSVTMAVAGDEGFVIASDLPPLAEGQVYELWSITGTAPTSLSCFPTGAGAVVQPIAGPIEGADVAAVTVEDASCPSAPTTDPVFAATLA